MKTEFRDFTQAKGVKTEAVSEGVYVFEYKDLHWVFMYEEEATPQYFRLLLPRVGGRLTLNEQTVIENVTNRIMALNFQYKVVKAAIVQEDSNDKYIWIAFEQYVYSNDRLGDLFERGLSSCSTYFEELSKVLNNV